MNKIKVVRVVNPDDVAALADSYERDGEAVVGKLLRRAEVGEIRLGFEGGNGDAFAICTAKADPDGPGAVVINDKSGLGPSGWSTSVELADHFKTALIIIPDATDQDIDSMVVEAARGALVVITPDSAWDAWISLMPGGARIFTEGGVLTAVTFGAR